MLVTKPIIVLIRVSKMTLKKQAQFLAKLESILGEKLPTETRGGVSDANIVSAAGVVTIDGFGPFGEHDHTKDERACKKSCVKTLPLRLFIGGLFTFIYSQR
ncbi:MAG: acetylornithine deacetylase/succinyl-diaminopimelate desuccinylase-like protein [Gammaproteobacteria bacterium]|jgi:acetylornithine deacetylase/succinyl-diaminopimelate desuccinylase-like protein